MCMCMFVCVLYPTKTLCKLCKPNKLHVYKHIIYIN